MSIYSSLISNQTNKKFALLIDPDKGDAEYFEKIAKNAQKANVDLFFVGGSLLTKDNLEICIKTLKNICKIPVVLFPGNTLQISKNADAIFFLSLISGRNPDMLIGLHVLAAPYLKLSSLEIIPTGYMLIESGKTTSVQYMSNSAPIPADKDDIAVCTAMAGEMLGLKLIYMDAGSGALNPISTSMITNVKLGISVPLIIGGGIRDAETAVKACKAGADIVVVGNAIEKDTSLITSIADAIHSV